MPFPSINTSHLFSLLYGNLFHRDWRLAWMQGIALLIQCILWISIVLQWNVIGETGSDIIILHYKVGLGPDLIGPWYEFFILPLVGLVILVLNGALARAWYVSAKQGAYALAMTSCAVQIMLFWAVQLVIRINLF